MGERIGPKVLKRRSSVDRSPRGVPEVDELIARKNAELQRSAELRKQALDSFIVPQTRHYADKIGQHLLDTPIAELQFPVRGGAQVEGCMRHAVAQVAGEQYGNLSSDAVAEYTKALKLLALRRAAVNTALENAHQGMVLSEQGRTNLGWCIDSARQQDVSLRAKGKQAYEKPETERFFLQAANDTISSLSKDDSQIDASCEVLSIVAKEETNPARVNIVDTIQSLRTIADRAPSPQLVEETERLMNTAIRGTFSERDERLVLALTQQIAVQYNAAALQAHKAKSPNLLITPEGIQLQRLADLLQSRGVDLPSSVALTGSTNSPLKGVPSTGSIKIIKEIDPQSGRATMSKIGTASAVGAAASLGLAVGAMPASASAATYAVSAEANTAAPAPIDIGVVIDMKPTTATETVEIGADEDATETVALIPESDVADTSLADEVETTKDPTAPASNENLVPANDPALETPIDLKPTQATPTVEIVAPSELEEDFSLAEEVTADDEWDRAYLFEKFEDTISTDFNGNHERINQNELIELVEATIAEFDEHMGTKKNVSDKELEKYRMLTVYAQSIAEYPTSLAQLRLKGLYGNGEDRFTEVASEILIDAGLNDDPDALYTVEQRSVLIKLLAEAYGMTLSEKDKQELLDIFDSVEEKSDKKDTGAKQKKGKKKGFGIKKPKQDQNTGSQHEKMTKEQIHQEVLDRMEAMGPEWKNRARTYRNLTAGGLKVIDASGFIGNFVVEAAGTELNPAIEQIGGGPGRGKAQWGSYENEYDRFGHGENGVNRYGTLRWFAENFKGGAENWSKNDVQDAFVLWELEHTEVEAAKMLRAADSVYDATYIVLNHFERPAERHIALRLKYARESQAMYDRLYKKVAAENKQKAASSKPEKKHDASNSGGARLEKYGVIKDRLVEQSGNLSGKLTHDQLQRVNGVELYEDAAIGYRAMATAFEKEFGKALLASPRGGYRTYERQDEMYQSWKTGEPMSDGRVQTAPAAEPGTSEHGWGMAVDISTDVVSGWTSAEYRWLLRNAHKFGWYKPDWSKYGQERAEIWHWEYAGGVKNPNVKKPKIAQKKSQPQQSSQKPEHIGLKPEKQKKPKGLVSPKGWTTPVPPSMHKVGTAYDGYENIEGVHTGIDYPVPVGTPVRAAKSGVVEEVGSLGSTGILNITINHGNGMYSDYQHLSTSKVTKGQHVKIGEVIAASGNSGGPTYSTGPHLHFTISTTPGVEGKTSENVREATQDPMRFLPSEAAAAKWVANHG